MALPSAYPDSHPHDTKDTPGVITILPKPSTLEDDLSPYETVTFEVFGLSSSTIFCFRSYGLWHHYQWSIFLLWKQRPTRSQFLDLGPYFWMGPLLLVTRILGTKIAYSM
jgi:hypothetical protein